jgi:hypothetical protein
MNLWEGFLVDNTRSALRRLFATLNVTLRQSANKIVSQSHTTVSTSLFITYINRSRLLPYIVANFTGSECLADSVSSSILCSDQELTCCRKAVGLLCVYMECFILL